MTNRLRLLILIVQIAMAAFAWWSTSRPAVIPPVPPVAIPWIPQQSSFPRSGQL